jgi:hypothetical protein
MKQEALASAAKEILELKATCMALRRELDDVRGNAS